MKAEQEPDTVHAVRRVARRALVLAIARYVAERPAAQPTARLWLDEDELALLSTPGKQLAEEANKSLAELEHVEARLRRDDELWQTRRVDVVHARLTLQAARSATFGSAVGMFRDFLRDAGEEPQTLDIH